MSKREEIRWGIELAIRKGIQASTLGEHRSLAQTVDDVLAYLHSQGCVLKVDRELAVHDYLHWHRGEWCFTPKMFAKFIDDKAGYVAVEPLIEKQKPLTLQQCGGSVPLSDEDLRGG